MLSVTQQQLRNDDGFLVWQVQSTLVPWDPEHTALLICDMWDRHWSRGATQRTDQLAPQIDALARTLRTDGVLIVHCPSGTMRFYEVTPAYQRLYAELPPPLPNLFPPLYPTLPIDDTDGGSDTGERVDEAVWTRQHPSIEIDMDRDIVGEDPQYLFAYFRQHLIHTVLVAGVHTNMCVLNRPFGIKQLTLHGFQPYLVEDLTDAMYNPARNPYVSHDAGTQLVVHYIQKFICPTVSSAAVREAIAADLPPSWPPRPGVEIG